MNLFTRFRPRKQDAHLPDLRPELAAALAREARANELLNQAIDQRNAITADLASMRPKGPDYSRYWTADELARKPFLNIGAGNWRLDHWRNVEMVSDHYGADELEVDISHDLMSDAPLPVESNSIDLVYTSHTIEHLMLQDNERLFAECFRVLKPGGVFRITCPEHEFYYRAYLAGDKHWFPYPETASVFPIESVFLTEIAGQLAPHNPDMQGKKLDVQYVREILRTLPMADALDKLVSHIDRDLSRSQPSAHKCWWAAPKVMTYLERAGFKPYRSGWRQSTVPVMRGDMFDVTIPWLSLFVEGIKGEPRNWHY